MISKEALTKEDLKLELKETDLILAVGTFFRAVALHRREQHEDGSLLICKQEAAALAEILRELHVGPPQMMTIVQNVWPERNFLKYFQLAVRRNTLNTPRGEQLWEAVRNALMNASTDRDFHFDDKELLTLSMIGRGLADICEEYLAGGKLLQLLRDVGRRK